MSKTFKIVICLEHTFTEENIIDLLSVAFEGGISDWCDSATIISTLPTNNLPSLEDAIMFRHEVLLKAFDGKSYILTLDKFIAGIKRYCTEFGVPMSELMNVQDSNTVDAIVQLAILTDITYC